MNKKIRILLADDHKLIREGVASMILQTEDMEVVASVGSGEDSINACRELSPDVVLMDIMMPGMTGIEATRWIKTTDAQIKVILVSQEVSKEYVSAAIKSGVDGYLPKDIDGDTLLLAVRSVHSGQRFFNDAIMKLVFEDFYSSEKSKTTRTRLPNELTNREFEVLKLVASGKPNKQVAEELFISVKTVETHKTNILEKLGLKNTPELVKYAIKNKIISVD